MPCFTRIEILPDTELNQRARKALGLPLKGGLLRADAQRVKIEASMIKTQEAMQQLTPDVLVQREGDDTLHFTVTL